MADAAKWRSTITDCLAAAEREQIGSACPVVDHEVIVSPGSEEASVWCICRNPEEKRLFTDTELARFGSAAKRKMLQAGVPEEVIASLRIRGTSRSEVDAAGGRLSFFR